MIEILLDPKNPTLIVKASGLLRAVDYEELMPELKKLVPEPYHRGLLLDWTELDGWDEEGESHRFMARLEMRGNLERVAVLADEDWNAQVTRLQEVCMANS